MHGVGSVKVLSVLSEKGGAGKTTVAVHVAVAAHLSGLASPIIDLDPQASAAEWADTRGEAPEAVAIPPSRLQKLLTDLSGNGADLVIIDTPREANNAGYIAATNSDLILIPFRRGGFDFRGLKRTLDLCRIAQKRPYILLNGMRIGATRVHKDVRDALTAYDGLSLAPVLFSDRAAYVTASITGRTAQETDPTSQAAQETRELFDWIAHQVRLSPTRQSEEATTP
jgi:chromosome partitioning protein